MFVMRKTDFDKFCQWQFSILEECEKHIKPLPYSRYNRIYGYFAEYLLPIYCLHNQMKIHHDGVVDMIGNHTKKQNWIRKELSVLFRQSPASSFDDIIKTSVLVGMKNDGIL